MMALGFVIESLGVGRTTGTSGDVPQKPKRPTSDSPLIQLPDLDSFYRALGLTMASLASGLFKSLPKPKYTGEEEEIPQHAQPRGPRVVGADQLDETQVVLRVSCSCLMLN